MAIPVWKDCIFQISAGGIAGFLEICCMYPLDVVKTRFQVQKGNAQYTSIVDCLGKTIRNEGFFAIYKGILPPIIAETPKRACKFFTFEQYKNLFTFGSKTSSYAFAMAGCCAGLTEAFIVNPFEVVKVRLQTDTQRFNMQQSSFATAKLIYKEGGFGLNGLNRGLTSTLGRHGIWSGVYFGFYHNIKVFIPKPKNKIEDYTYRSIAGFAAGSFASTINIPWDVAKSRIQAYHPENTPRKYTACIQTIVCVFREEGFKALFKGLVPKIARFGPGGALMIVSYEEIYKLLKNNF